jgi:hypothetical protein
MWREFQPEKDHRSMRLTAPTLRAPADRIGGRRGWRGRLAVLAVLGALVTLVLSRATESGSWSGGGWAVEYSADGPSWTGPTLVAATIALVLAALLLWVARSPALLGVALALAAVAVAGAVVARGERHGAGRVTRAQARAVQLGTPEGDVTAALGAPWGHGTMRRRAGEQLDCLMYRNASAEAHGPGDYAFCFRDGRLAVREGL